MKLTEMEERCKRLTELKEQLKTKKEEATKLEAEDIKRKQDIEVMQILADIRGDDCKLELTNEPLHSLGVKIQELNESIQKSETAILEGLKQLKLDVLPPDISVPNSDKKVEIKFNGTFENAVNYLGYVMNSELPIQVDSITINPTSIVIDNVEEKMHAALALKGFVDNLSRLALIALNEKIPEEVIETAKYFHDGQNRKIWEAINGRKVISNQTLYTELGITQVDEKKKMRNFWTNTRICLKNNYPFLVLGDGTFQLSFFGTLVWKYYQETFGTEARTSQIIDTPQDDSTKEKRNIAEPKRENKSKESLNAFFDEEKINETLYGGKV